MISVDEKGENNMESDSAKNGVEEIILRPKKRRPAVKYLLLFLALDAAVTGWWFYLSPQARIKHVVKEMAASFEGEDAAGLMSHVSESYSDPGGNTKEDLGTVVKMFFDLCEESRASADKLTVQVKGDGATVAIEGRISYSYKGTPQRTKYNKNNPFVITMRREDGLWRVESMPAATSSLGDFRMFMNEMRNF